VVSSSPPQIDQGRWLLRSALGMVAIVALLILLRFLGKSR
jgi:hypothetical protein